MTLKENAGKAGPRVIGLAGSLREKSYTRRAVQLALDAARAAGADADLIDLRALTLPFCTGDKALRESFPDVERLRAEIRGAHGIVLGTPEYHGSISGVLKNALDLTDLEDWQGRVLGLVAVSGGSAGPGSALVGLRTVGRGLAAWVLPQQVSIASAYKAFDRDGQLLSAEHAAELVEFGRELTHAARLLMGNR